MTRPRLLLVVDRAPTAHALRGPLSRDYEVVAVVPFGDSLGPAVAMHQPDTVVLDLSRLGRHGLRILQQLKAVHSELPVVTLHGDHDSMSSAERLGAEGCVSENVELDELRTAIAHVLAGRRYLPQSCSRGDAEGEAKPASGFERLTPRQREIILYLSQDLTSRQIADRMGLSPWTVHFHRKNILKRLGLRTDKEMHRYAILAAAEVAKEK